ncbi:MAG TPA: ATP-binding protein [Chloroflexia bacterium]|nr:ATP-binding protein [Chloroflexia bacterium]
MSFAHRAMSFINWLRNNKGPVLLTIVVLEILIGFLDYWVADDVPITDLHFITIALAAVLFDWAGIVAISITATILFYVATYVADGRPLAQIAIPSAGLTFLIFLGIGASALLILRLLKSLHVSNQELSEKLQQLQASRARIELLTSERERTRLARELHDGVAKTLLGVEYSAAALAQALPPGNSLALERAHFIQNICHTEGEQLRQVILDLRQGNKEPLFASVKEYLRRWEVAYNSQTDLKLSGSDQDIDPSTVYELMAIIEEALENVQRHSSANKVWVTLAVNDQTVALKIRDNGKGLAPEILEHFKQSLQAETALYNLTQPFRGTDGRPRFGLTGMIERAEWLGGKLLLANDPEGGMSIEVIVPVHHSAFDFGSTEDVTALKIER